MERQAETRRLDDFQPRTGDALIVVDVQNDFLPGGKLAVTAGDEVVPALNEYQRRFVSRGLPIFATRDWHPTDHCSFTQRGGRWPAHCVAGTPGAEFAAGLLLPAAAVVISKATLPEAEAYSAFAGGDLAQRLRRAGVGRLFVGGLATDYCVLETVRDGLAEGFAVVLLVDAVRAVSADDGARAVAQMSALGAGLACLGEAR